MLSCDEVREAISAQLDNEPSGRDPASVEEHLGDCPDCRSWREQAHRVTRRVRLAPADGQAADPDQLLALVRAELHQVRGRSRRRLAVRLGLAAVALGQLAIVILVLGLGHAGMGGAMAGMAGMAHMDHELVAFNAALAVAFGFAAWRPARARGMVPMAGLVALALLAAAGIDIADGTISLLHEVQHLLLVLGWLLLWALARTEGRRPGVPTGDQLRPPEHADISDADEPRTRRPHAIRPRPPAARHVPGKVAVLLFLATVVGVLATGARPASAHAVLEHTTPGDGSVVSTAPKSVSLEFGEPVTVESDSLLVFDDHLHRVDTGKPVGNGPRVSVGLRGGLHPGTYTVTWRVVSADSHPVSGGFTFSLDHASAVNGTVGSESGGSRLVGILLGAARFAAYAGIVLGLGLAAVLLALWPAGRRETGPRRLIWTGWGLLLAGTVVGLLLEGPYGAGRGITHTFDGSLLSDTFHARYGEVLGARLGLLILLAAGLVAALRGSRLGVWLFAASGVAVLVSFALAGHAATGGQVPLTTFSDVLHLTAMAGWLGGLVLLVACLFRRAELRAVLPPFSRLAFTAVTVLVATGTYQAWRNVGSWSALTDTTYGRLLLAKIGCVVVLLALGNASRRWVARNYARPALARAQAQPVTVGGPPPAPVDPPTPPEPPLAVLRRGLAAEVVIGVAVLVLTTILVNTAQGKESGAGVGVASYHTTDTGGQTQVALTVTPARTGTVTMSLRVRRPSGPPIPVQKVSAALSLPAQNIGPLPVTFTVPKSGPITARTDIARAGRWFLDVTVQTSPIEATAFRLTIPIQ